MRFLILLGAFLLSLCGQADAQQCIQCMAGQPTAADCIVGYQWTYLNGFWRCAKPAPPPAPTCPIGYQQTAAPVWNGTSWVGLGCAVPPETVQPPTVGTIVGICSDAVNEAFGGPRGSWGTWQGPTSSDVPPQMQHGGYAFLTSNKYWQIEGYNGPEDMYWAVDTGNRATSSTGSGVTAICYFTPGTSTLIGIMQAYVDSYDGG